MFPFNNIPSDYQTGGTDSSQSSDLLSFPDMNTLVPVSEMRDFYRNPSIPAIDDGFEIIEAPENKTAGTVGDGNQATLGQVNVKEMEQAAAAIDQACNGGLLGFGTASRKIFAILQDKTAEEIQTIDEIYKEKFGKKYGNNFGLEQEFRDEMSGATLDRALSLLRGKDVNKGDDAGIIHSALIEVNQNVNSSQIRLDSVPERTIRDTLSTMNSEQIDWLKLDYQKRYPDSKGLESDLLDNSNLSDTTKDAIKVYLKGAENRSDSEIVNLANTALEAKNLNMFKEAFRLHTSQAMNMFLNEGGREKIMAAFGAPNFGPGYRETKQTKMAFDILDDGRLSIAFRLEQDQTVFNDNERSIEETLRTISDQDRQNYQIGRALVQHGVDIAVLAKPEADAVSFYRDVNEQLCDAGDSTEVLKWEDMIAHKGGSLVTTIADQHGFWNDDEAGVFKTIEDMSGKEWLRLKLDQTFRAQVDSVLKSFLGGQDLSRATELLDQKMAIELDMNNLQQSVENAISKPIAPEEGIFERLGKSLIVKKPADIPDAIRKVEEEVLRNPALCQRLLNPESEEDRRLVALIDNATWRKDYPYLHEQYVKPLLENGRLPLEVKVQLNRGDFNDVERGFYHDVLAATPEEKQKLLNDKTYQDQVLGALSRDERAIALNVARQNEMRPEDDLRACMVGYGTDETRIKLLLGDMPKQQLTDVKVAYATKYGDLIGDLHDELGGLDLTIVQEMVQDEAINDREAFNRARKRYYTSRENGNGLVDDFGDATGYNLDEAHSNFARRMTEFARQFQQMPVEQRRELSVNLNSALELYIQSEGAAADALVNALMAVGAVGGAAFTGGVSLTLLGFVAAGGAALKIGTKALVMGNDYDWSSTQPVFDGLSGALEADLNVIGPGQVAKLFGLGEKAGSMAAQEVLERAGMSLVEAGQEKAFKDGVVTVMRHAIANGARSLDDRLIATVVEQVAVKGQEKTLATLLANTLQKSIQTEARNALTTMLTKYAVVGASGGIGGGVLGIDNALMQWDDTLSVSENLERVAKSGLISAAIGAGAAVSITGALDLGTAGYRGLRTAAANQADDSVDNLALAASDSPPAGDVTNSDVPHLDKIVHRGDGMTEFHSLRGGHFVEAPDRTITEVVFENGVVARPTYEPGSNVISRIDLSDDTSLIVDNGKLAIIQSGKEPFVLPGTGEIRALSPMGDDGFEIRFGDNRRVAFSLDEEPSNVFRDLDSFRRVTVKPAPVVQVQGRGVVEIPQPDGTIKVTAYDGKGGAKELVLDADRTWVDAKGSRYRYYTQDEIAEIYRASAADAPVNLGQLADSDRAGLLSGHKKDYQVELQPVLAKDYPQGVELSTREYALVAQKPLRLQTNAGEIELTAGASLPIGARIDRVSGQLITPAEGIRLETGQFVKTQMIDTDALTGGQHLTAGTPDAPGDWVVLRRTNDDFGNPIFDSYHQSDATKQKKWDFVEGDTYKAKTSDSKDFVVMPGGNATISTSYGQFASNGGPGVLVKDGTKGYYFIGIEELKETHLGDLRSQQIVDRIWSKYKAQKTGGYWSELFPDRYTVKQPDGTWRTVLSGSHSSS